MTEDEFIRLHKRRGYLHFDAAVNSAAKAWEIVTEFLDGEPYSFMPFLGFTMTTNRIRRGEDEAKTRRERSIVLRPKNRAIKIAGHRDAVIYSYFGLLLSKRYEACLEDRGLLATPTAFRSVGNGRCNIDHAQEVFDFVKANRPCVALGFDVEKFFDRLSHRVLREAWADVLGTDRLPPEHYKVFHSLTRFSWVSRDAVFEEFGINPHRPGMDDAGKRRPRICLAAEFRDRVRGKGLLQRNPEKDRGIPQGSPMSAVLSNIYMLRFDAVMDEWAKSVGGLYRRYCDDIIVVVPPQHVAATETLVNDQIESLELNLNCDKTERVHFGSEPGSRAADDQALPYLGFSFDGTGVRLRQSSLDRYYGKMRRGVRFAALCRKRHDVPGSRLKTRKLFLKYSHFVCSQRGGVKIRKKLGQKRYRTGRTNFISYATRAADTFKSREIRRQIKGHWKKLSRQIAYRDKCAADGCSTKAGLAR